MDVKRMHDMIEKLSECAKAELDKGIEKLDVCEFGQVTDMLKDLSEAMYYRTLTHTMEEFDPESMLDVMDRYGDRRFYDNYRYSNGRFAPKGRGTRRGYEDYPPYWHMTPEMYRMDGKEYNPDRDIDRNKGRMYYTEEKPERKYNMARRAYTEAREGHKDKDTRMHELESYMSELSKDVTDLIGEMSNEERTLAKAKLSTLISKM